MLIFDAHLDLAWNALDWNRDLRLPVADIRRRERQLGMTDKGRGENTVSFPELRRGKVGLFIATLLARLLRPNLIPAIQRYESMEAAYAAAQGQMAYYRALEQQGYLRWIKDATALQAHVHGWQAPGGEEREPLGFILSMEGADPVLAPDRFRNGGTPACASSARPTTASVPMPTAPAQSAASSRPAGRSSRRWSASA